MVSWRNDSGGEIKMSGNERHAASLGSYAAAFQNALDGIASRQVVRRIWTRDPTVWSDEPEHQAIIRNALGWLTVAEDLLEKVRDLKPFADEVRRDGFQFVVVLGMGGSS